jgi:hypothetical protein
MSTQLSVYVNTDTQDFPYPSSGIDWTLMALSTDSLIFSAGSDTVKDGEVIPSATQLTQAGTLISTVAVTVAKYFLADVSANLLKEIHNMGNKDKRYVLGFYFDGATASEPVLEVWDDEDMDSIDLKCLGDDNADNSWIKGITTTAATPGADWVGSNLAGSEDGHFLYLNDENGALSVAGTLYCNLKVVIPASFQYGGSESPVFVVKYCSN